MSLLKRLRDMHAQPASKAVSKVKPTVDDSLIPHLIASDAELEDNRKVTQAHRGAIHVSSLPDLCPRAYVLATTYGSVNTDNTQAKSNDHVVWAIGRAVEEHVRSSIIRRLSPQRVRGKWECPCGRDTEKYRAQSETGFKPCGCGHKLVDQYKELPVVDAETNITGSCDLPYYGGDGKLVLTEIKSVTGDYFKEMRGRELCDMPKAPIRLMVSLNKFQITAYHRLYSLKKWRLADYVRLIYVSKNYLGMRKKDLPYLEYTVPMDDEVNSRLDREWDKARTVKRHCEEDTMPERLPVCTVETDSRAKQCPMVTFCFMSRR